MADLQRAELDERVYTWRGIDALSLEVLRLRQGSSGHVARSHVLVTEPDALAFEYEFRLDDAWRSLSLQVNVIGADEKSMRIERAGEGAWRIEGERAPELDGCDEVDLSITPFCNTLALRRLGPPPGGEGEITALYVELPDLIPRRSRQRYERVAKHRFRYVDLGVQAGFESLLTVDADGFVIEYEGLFERVPA